MIFSRDFVIVARAIDRCDRDDRRRRIASKKPHARVHAGPRSWLTWQARTRQSRQLARTTSSWPPNFEHSSLKTLRLERTEVGRERDHVVGAQLLDHGLHQRHGGAGAHAGLHVVELAIEVHRRRGWRSPAPRRGPSGPARGRSRTAASCRRRRRRPAPRPWRRCPADIVRQSRRADCALGARASSCGSSMMRLPIGSLPPSLASKRMAPAPTYALRHRRGSRPPWCSPPAACRARNIRRPPSRPRRVDPLGDLGHRGSADALAAAVLEIVRAGERCRRRAGPRSRTISGWPSPVVRWQSAQARSSGLRPSRRPSASGDGRSGTSPADRTDC